jgi:hypothetical protein
MLGKIPGEKEPQGATRTNPRLTIWAKKGLLELHTDAPLATTASRAKGYNMGIVAVLKSPEHVASYAAHPVHQEYVSHLLHGSILG